MVVFEDSGIDVILKASLFDKYLATLEAIHLNRLSE